VVVSNSIFTGNLAVTAGGGAYNAGLNNCMLTANHALEGGGVFGLATNCVFISNIASDAGGGVSCFGSKPTVLGCSFTNNSALNGGAIASGTCAGCVFSANSATNDGGATYQAALSGCLVISNQAAFGGGACSPATYPPWGFGVLGSTFVGNSARNDGGGLVGPNATVTNSLFQFNSAGGNGGGVSSATLTRCALTGNSAIGNGGGAISGSLTLCLVSSNTAGANGGGIYQAGVNNSLVTGNTAASGGGTYGTSPGTSTIVYNHATVAGGGSYFPASTSITDCILYDNTAPIGPNSTGAVSCFYCCTTPPPAGGNHNLTNDPAFVNPAAANYRLQTNSPCINAGAGAQTTVDLDGRARIMGGLVDIGAYEFQGPGMGEFIAWLQQYGVPTSGAADYVDPDGDGLNNWQEWLAGTDPTDAASVLKMLPPVLSGNGDAIILSWQSVTNHTYFLQQSAGALMPLAFSTLQSNILGQFGTTSYTDTNALGSGAVLYRVGVQ
jgi:predicted outer membrane repeat protein